MDSNTTLFTVFVIASLYLYSNGNNKVTKYITRRSIDRPYIDAKQFLSTSGIPVPITKVSKEKGSFLGIPRYFASTSRGENIILYQLPKSI